MPKKAILVFRAESNHTNHDYAYLNAPIEYEEGGLTEDRIEAEKQLVTVPSSDITRYIRRSQFQIHNIIRLDG